MDGNMDNFFQNDVVGDRSAGSVTRSSLAGPNGRKLNGSVLNFAHCCGSQSRAPRRGTDRHWNSQPHSSGHLTRDVREVLLRMNATLSSDGKIVLPPEVRDSAQLKPGDVLEVQFHKGTIVLRKISR